MSDLISRQAVIDALEKVAELYPWRVPGDSDSYSSYNEAWQDALNRVGNEIEALPSVHPEIIRCKDCAFSHRYIDFDGSNWIECRNPNGLNRDVADDGYCYAGAERRTDETD